MFLAMEAKYVYTIGWLIFMVICVFVEATTVQFVSIWFACGALVATILGACNVSFAWQIVAFVVVSALALILSRPLVKKFKEKKFDVPGSASSLIGQSCVVTEKVTEDIYGTVKTKYDSYGAISIEGSFEVGEKATIVEVRGNKLVIKK